MPTLQVGVGLRTAVVAEVGDEGCMLVVGGGWFKSINDERAPLVNPGGDR